MEAHAPRLRLRDGDGRDGAVYQVNLLMAGLFQANADVPGFKAFPLEGIVLASGFAVATLVLLVHRERR